MHVCGQWEEAGENPRMHRDRMQTPRGKVPAGIPTRNRLAVRIRC